MGISTFPVHVLSKDISVEVLKDKLLDCLRSSRSNVVLSPDSDEFAEHSKNILKALGEKNYTNIYKTSSGCSIEKKDTEYKMIVYQLYDTRNPKFGFARDYDLSFSTIEGVIEKLLEL